MSEIEYTPNLTLAKQPTGALGWGDVLNENFDKIDESFGNFDALPPQQGNAGKFLTTDGTNPSWADVGGGLEIGDIGFAPLGIDEAQNKRRYLNGQVISQAQFVSFTNKVKAAIELYPNLATSETNWQATVTNSKLGQCGKFVIDDTLGTIRLPKVVNINGLQDLALMGSIKAESLPNITGMITARSTDDDYSIVNGSGVFDTNISGGNIGTVSHNNSTNTTNSGVNFDASRSSSTYQDNAPVQQEAIQYPYFIQVATGTEESVDVTREIELNNPFSLLDYKWSEYELNNASWLISNGSFHSGATYVAVYELLLKIYNGTETKEGVSVKLSTEAYEDTDFVLNTVDTTFRLPIKVKLASGNMIVGNGMTLGLTNGTANAGTGIIVNDGIMTINQYGNRVSSTGATSSGWTGGTILGVTTDPLKSGIETSSSGLKLYFYVGETIQDANVINASGVLTRVADLSNSYISGLGMPSNRRVNLTISSTGTQFTAPANGWFDVWVQGGTTSNNKYLEIVNNTTGLSQGVYGNANFHYKCHLPARKGDKVTINYNNMEAAPDRCRFIYSEGEV